MATAPSTGNTAASALPAAGGTSESTLSSWAGPYVTNMLGKAQAVANEPYQVYQGPMTAGQSNLQSKVFQGLGGLSFPGNLGQSFSSGMGGQQPQYGGTSAAGGLPPGAMAMPAYKGSLSPNMSELTSGMPMQDDMPLFNQRDPSVGTANMPMGGTLGTAQTGENTGAPTPYDTTGVTPPPGMGFTSPMGTPPQGGIAGLTPPPPQGSQQPSNIAQSYMNPYLQSVLNPQMDELRRQNDITNMQANAKLTGAGAFGGGRQAIMNAENNRNLMMEQNKTVGQGYANAYDKAMGQFNTEQGQSKDLVNMLANAGQAQRGIEQEGITADYNEFLAQRDDPMKKTQYLQSMLQGLPYQTVTNSPLPKSGLGQLAEITGSLPGIEDTLKNLGLMPPA